MEPSFRCNRAAHLQIEPNPATLTPPFNHRSVIPRTRLQYREVTQPGAHDDAIIAVKLGPSAGSLLPSSVTTGGTHQPCGALLPMTPLHSGKKNERTGPKASQNSLYHGGALNPRRPMHAWRWSGYWLAVSHTGHGQTDG
jgi:hypothetical protein